MRRFIMLALIVAAIVVSITPHSAAVERDSQNARADENALDQLANMNQLVNMNSIPEITRNSSPANTYDHPEEITILGNLIAKNQIREEPLSSNPSKDDSNLDQLYRSILAKDTAADGHYLLRLTSARTTDSNLKFLQQGRLDTNDLSESSALDSSAALDTGSNLQCLQTNDAARFSISKNSESDTIQIMDGDSNFRYIYERYPVYKNIRRIDRIADSDIQSGDATSFDYMYSNIDPYKSTLSDNRIANTYSKFGVENKRDLYLSYQVQENGPASKEDPVIRTESNLKYINELSLRIDRLAEEMVASDTRSNLDSIMRGIGNPGPRSLEDSINAIEANRSPIFNNLEALNANEIQDRYNKYVSLGKKDIVSDKKDYAIVIGIDNYQDRRSLHNSVNDANKFASLLELYGYNVTKLTDETPSKPTKYNILDVALDDAKEWKDRGNIIIYFSGHGELDDRGDYYLIPQDANGDNSTFISENELGDHIKDIKNLAIIVDACNSGALSTIAGNDQMILTSSRAEEASNEDWVGSLSVFTKNLCGALEKTHTGNEIPLQRCFEEAYNNTVSWSRSHLLSQKPIISDMTQSKKFSLKARNLA